MLGVDSPDLVVSAFRSAFLEESRKLSYRVAEKARPVFDEVMKSLSDFGPKLNIGVTPNVELVSYTMLRSDYEDRFAKIDDVTSAYYDMLRDEELFFKDSQSSENLIEFLRYKLSKMESSPLDNPFVRPRDIHPRLEDRFFGIAKVAIRYVNYHSRELEKRQQTNLPLRRDSFI